MARIRLLVLGPPRLERDGRPIALNLRRAMALLVYLANTAQPRSRDALTALLWPDSDEREARGRLRRTLHRLVQAVGVDVLEAEGETLRLSPRADLWVDALAFEQQAAAGLETNGQPAGASPNRTDQLSRAAALYTDDFLAGFGLEDSPAWDDWQFLQREHLRQLAARVLETLVDQQQRAGAWQEGLDHARRWLALDPLNEAAHRALMRLYASAGQQAAALRQYEQCTRLLNAELAVEPEPETSALYQEVRGRRLAPATARDRPGQAGQPPAPNRDQARAAGQPAAPGSGGHSPESPSAPPQAATRPPTETTVPGRGSGQPATASARDSADLAGQPTASAPDQARPADSTSGLGAPAGASPAPDGSQSTVPLVGRDTVLAQLGRSLDQALGGTRQIVFVTGEAGLGKTALVESFLSQAGRPGQEVLVGQGQCLQRQGMGEAYLPVLEALGRLGRQPGGESVIALLARQAPTWLVQLPGLVPPVTLERLQQKALGATRERMLREMVEALEALSHERPLIVVLEDLHWSDPSTRDLLAWLARRREPARLLVIGTYRPAEARAQQHPLDALTRELRLHGLCQEIALPYLSLDEVEAFLTMRFPGAALPAELAQQVRQRTDGNPLFLVNVVNSWIARGLLTQAGADWRCQAGLEELTSSVPDDLRALIEEQISRLSPEAQEVLESAAVAGMEFSAASAAAGLEATEEAVESRCAGLARRGQLLRAVGTAEWPDGTIAGQFGFTHHLYQQVLYERVPAGKRVRLHRQIGARLELAYGSQPGPVLADLIVHFTQARDSRQAVRYQQLAAQQALQRSAHREAIEHARAGLEVIQGWADTPERAIQELKLQAILGPAFIVTHGWGSRDAERAFRRARELCQELQDAPLRFQVLFGLAALHEWRGEFDQSEALIQQRFQGEDSRQSQDCLLESYDLLACSLFHQGQFERSLQRAEEGLSQYDPADQYALIATFGEDPGVQCYGWAAQSLWFLGHPDQALERARAALPLAQEHPYSLASAQLRLASVHQFRREPDQTRQWADAAILLGATQGFPYQVAVGVILQGWALAMLGRETKGIELIHGGLRDCRATGALLDDHYFLALLAEAYSRAGRVEEALRCIAEGLAQIPGRRTFYYEAELHRLAGALRLQAGTRAGPAEAEACFLRALETARRQQARSLELRAAVSLGGLWCHQGRAAEARRLLSEVSAACSEGLQTADGQEARALIEALERMEARGPVKTAQD